MSLSEILSEKRNATAKNLAPEKYAIMQAGTKALIKDSLSAKAVQSGKLPSFSLLDINERKRSLEEFKSEFLIISFYRGGWCPYCNFELKALQDILPELKKLDADLIAISPETPDNSLTTAEKNELSFAVLSDVDNTYAKSLGLVFQMPEDLRELYYNSFNISVDVHNGNKDYELPMAATYVINGQREIVYSFISEDYTERLEPSIILDVLNKQ